MSVNYGDMTKEELITPEFYFAGNRFMKSDRPWICSQLILLTFEQKKHVCSEYRDIYLKQGRREANTYLKTYVDSHGSGGNVKASAFANGVIPDGLKARIARIKESQKHKTTILGIADSKK